MEKDSQALKKRDLKAPRNIIALTLIILAILLAVIIPELKTVPNEKTASTIAALDKIRDLSNLKWYTVPLLSVIFYIYASEIQEARRTGQWNPVYAALTLLGVDFINETWNGWVLNITGRSAFWTAPGGSALKILVGWNIEILLMFSICGFVYWNMLSKEGDKTIFNIPEKWFCAIFMSAFAVFVEFLLNMADLLVWEYQFWNRNLCGAVFVFLIGYFHFFCAIIWVTSRKSDKTKIAMIASFYGIAVVMNIIGFKFLGFMY